MDQYLLIPLLVGWTSIYQLFWGSLGARVLTNSHIMKLPYDWGKIQLHHVKPGFWLISWGKLIPPLLQIMFFFFFPRGKSTTGGIVIGVFLCLLWPASKSQSCKSEYIGIFGMTWILNAINLIPQKKQDVSASKFPLTQSIDIVGFIPMISPSHISIQQLDWLPMAHASYLRHLQPNVWLLKSSFVLVKYH